MKIEEKKLPSPHRLSGETGAKAYRCSGFAIRCRLFMKIYN